MHSHSRKKEGGGGAVKSFLHDWLLDVKIKSAGQGGILMLIIVIRGGVGTSNMPSRNCSN